MESGQKTSVEQRSGAPVVCAVGVGKTFLSGGSRVAALRSVDLSVGRGEFVAVMGASGSGKSTLLHLLGGLDDADTGSIRIDDRDLAVMGDRARTIHRRRRIGVVFQAYNLLPTLTALENVALPAVLDGVPEAVATERARSLLARVDMSHRLTHRPQALSGGEQQRVAIARALVNDPAVLLADEPTGNLDSEHGREIWSLMASLARDDGRTVVAVTHESDGAAFADRVVVLKDGRIMGEVRPGGADHAANLAARYRELVG